MYESTHCFRIDVGSSSYPDAEFFIADMIVLTSFTCTSGIDIHLSVLCTYSKGLLLEWILLAKKIHVESISNHFTIRKSIFLTEHRLSSFPIMFLIIFHDFLDLFDVNQTVLYNNLFLLFLSFG